MKKKRNLILAALCTAFIVTAATACNPTADKENAGTPPEQNVESPLPSIPETPDLPETPETPETPDSSVPSVPESPNNPSTPPVSNPVVPDEPETPQPEEPKVKTVQYIRVKVDDLNVRAKPSTTAAVLGQVDGEVSMLYLGKENGFYKTFYRNKEAYVSAKSSYTSLYETVYTSDTVEDVIEEGCKVIGTPYVYGAVRYHDGTGKKYKGFTVTKFDCSSLTQYIFYQGSGTLLQVNTRTQIYQGEYVKKSNLRRGDLIFFTNDARRNNKGIERVGHVALYLGDNLILHTASDYCKIEEVSNKRWNDYIEARRMVKA